MDVATAASFLGRGPDPDDSYVLVIRGERSLVLPSDTDDKPSKSAESHVMSVQGDDRRAAYAAARQPQA